MPESTTIRNVKTVEVEVETLADGRTRARIQTFEGSLLGDLAGAVEEYDRQDEADPDGGLSRRESLVRLALLPHVVSGVVSGVVGVVVGGVVGGVINTPPPPQRQAVEQSGVTHHRVDALAGEGVMVETVGISFSVPRVPDTGVTVVRAPVVWRA